MRGLLAVGKSSFSRSLGARLGWPVIDKDNINDILISRVENSGPFAYEAMFSVADSLLAQGFSVICDSPLRGLEGYEHATTLAERHAVKALLITCTCSDDGLWRERVETRARHPAQLVADWDTFQAYRTQVQLEPQANTKLPNLDIDTCASAVDNVQRATAWLKSQQVLDHREIST